MPSTSRTSELSVNHYNPLALTKTIAPKELDPMESDGAILELSTIHPAYTGPPLTTAEAADAAVAAAKAAAKHAEKCHRPRRRAQPMREGVGRRPSLTEETKGTIAVWYTAMWCCCWPIVLPLWAITFPFTILCCTLFYPCFASNRITNYFPMDEEGDLESQAGCVVCFNGACIESEVDDAKEGCQCCVDCWVWTFVTACAPVMCAYMCAKSVGEDDGCGD